MIAQPKLVSVIIIASSATFVSAAIPGYPTDLDRKISATITVRMTERDLSWVTPGLRPKVIARLREGLEDQDMREWGMAGLLALDDATTITALMNQWNSSSPDERGAALDMLCNNTPTATLLPLLAQHLDDVRIYRRGGGDTPGDLEWRDIAATEMNHVIYLRNEFPAATKAWARSLGREWPKHFQMKLWWERNKEKIEARRYAEAVWLPVSASDVMPIESYPENLLSPVIENDPISTVSVPQLRVIVERSQFIEQEKAAKALLDKGDQETVTRLVYALRRGNQFAEQILLESASLQMIPYLLEDVAHGSLRVRLAATAIMTAALARQTNLPPETVDWFAHLKRSYSHQLKYIPEHSKALIDWWSHNGEAVLAGRMKDANWLPIERNLVPTNFENWREANEAKQPPPPPPPLPPEPISALPLQVSESFEDWSKRMNESDRRDISWAMLDFETGISVRSTTQGMSRHKIPPNEFNRLKSASPEKSKPTDSDDPNVSIHWLIWVLILCAGIVTLWQTIRYCIQKLSP